MRQRIWDISSLIGLEKAAEEVLADVKSAPPNQAAVLALSGDLGAGKTTFTQTLARLLGISESITSPTFVIMKKYEVEGDPRFRHLVHVDAYRLNSIEELQVLHFETELGEANSLVVVEWAEKVKEILPPETKWFNFDLGGDGRTLTLN